jgi:hypothetical protein
MTMRNNIVAALLVVGLAFASVGQAADFILEFDMPAFSMVSPPQYFDGQTSTLQLTVDNGGTSSANQSYLNTDIFGMRVLTSGGTLIDLNATRNTFGSQQYITTDTIGGAILDLTASVGSYVYFIAKNEVI